VLQEAQLTQWDALADGGEANSTLARKMYLLVLRPFNKVSHGISQMQIDVAVSPMQLF